MCHFFLFSVGNLTLMSEHSCKRRDLEQTSQNWKLTTWRSRMQKGKYNLESLENSLDWCIHAFILFFCFFFSIVNIATALNKTSIVWQDVFDYHERVSTPHQNTYISYQKCTFPVWVVFKGCGWKYFAAGACKVKINIFTDARFE